MRAPLAILLLLLLTACGGHAQGSLARGVLPARSAKAIAVSSDAFVAGGQIALRNAGVGQNLSPSLRWTRVAGAQTYALVVQDSDSPGPKPLVHWLLWNVPGDATSLAEGVAPQPTLVIPDGAHQGANDAGSVGYSGPAPPSGVHHYHFQLFALDAPLPLAGGGNLDALLAAMKGHVLASGELIGTYTAGGA